MKRWLKRIILFPFSILMGDIAGGEVAADAGAVSPESQSPAAESVTATPEPTRDAGAVSPESQSPAAESVDVDGEDQTTGQEDAADAAGGKVRKSLDERVEELATKKIAEMEERITAKMQPEAKVELDFIPDLDFGKVNDYIKDTLGAIEQAQLDGDFVKALDLQEELRQTREAIKQNEARKAAHIEKEGLRTQSEKQIKALNEQIASASQLVAKEHKIPEDVWKKGEEFFAAERASKPLIDAQYREKVMLQGPVAALLWAKDYVEQNMGKKEQDLINSKETAKATLPQGKTSTGLMTDEKANKLAAAREAAKSGNPSDLAAYSEAKRESRL